MENYLIVFALVFFVLVIFPPTRNLLFSIMKGPLLWILGLVVSLATKLYKDHVLILRNFAPRRVIFPSLNDDDL